MSDKSILSRAAVAAGFNCEDFRHILDKVRQGNPGALDNPLVTIHLASCKECRQAAEDLVDEIERIPEP